MISHTCLIFPGVMPSPSRAGDFDLGLACAGALATCADAAVAPDGPPADPPAKTSTAAPRAASATHAATTLATLIRHLPACGYRTRMVYHFTSRSHNPLVC